MDSVWLCPHATLTQLFMSQFYSPSDPVIKNNGVPLIESQLRRRFALVLKMLQLPMAALTFHSLKRLGASVAFNNNVSFEEIRAHGAWQSDAIWHYLFTNSQKAKEVCNMFRNVEQKDQYLGQF